jgi:hypothetical protein
MSLNVFDPVGLYNTDHGTSYVGNGFIYEVESADEIWWALNNPPDQGESGAPQANARILRINQSTGEYIALADHPTGLLGDVRYRHILVDEFSGLVIATGFQYTNGANPSRYLLVAWNLDGTIAWETYWALSLHAVSYIIYNPTLGALYTVQPNSSGTTNKFQSLNLATGARTDTGITFLNGYVVVPIMTNDGYVWYADTTSSPTRIKRAQLTGTPSTTNVDSLATSSPTESLRRLWYDSVNDLAWWQVQQSSSPSLIFMRRYNGSVVSVTVPENARRYNAPPQFLGGVSAGMRSDEGFWEATVSSGFASLLLNLSTWAVEKRVTEAFEMYGGTATFYFFWTTTRAWARPSIGGTNKLLLWIDCNAEDGLEQITALFVGSATASRVNLFDMADFSYAGRIDKGDGNFMSAAASGGFTAAVKSKGYGYFADRAPQNNSGLYVHKILLVESEYQSSVFLTNPYPSGACSAPSMCSDGTYLYVMFQATGTGGGDLILFKVRESDMTVITSLDLTSDYGVYNVGGAVPPPMATSSGSFFLYVAALRPNEASPTNLAAHIVAVVPSTMTLNPTIPHVQMESGWDGAQFTTGIGNLAVIHQLGRSFVGGTGRASGRPEVGMFFVFSGYFSGLDVTMGNVSSQDQWVSSITYDGTYFYAVTSGTAAGEDSYVGVIKDEDYTVVSATVLSTESQLVVREAELFNNDLIIVSSTLPGAGAGGVAHAWKFNVGTLTPTVFAMDGLDDGTWTTAQRVLLACGVLIPLAELLRRHVSLCVIT